MIVVPCRYDEISFLREINKVEDPKELYCHIYEGTKPLRWYKVVYEAEVVGCCALLPFGKEARLRGWFLRKEWRGRGWGLQMAEHMVSEARRLGFARIEAKTRATLDFHGWKFTGRDYKTFGGRQFVIDLVESYRPDENPWSIEEARKFIGGNSWRWAKPNPVVAPHCYVVRENCVQKDFDRMVEFLRGPGSYVGHAYGRDWTYFDIDGWTYWTFGRPVPVTIIINRCERKS